MRVEVCPNCHGHGRQRVINGAWLKWTRERAGIDQRSFAAVVGVSGPYVSDIERNRRACPPRIAEAYKTL
jgi:transcriptional regulator with XRE-family HTH domain